MCLSVCLCLEESDDDEDVLDDEEPDLDTVMIQHNGAINRLRVPSITHSTYNTLTYYFIGLSYSSPPLPPLLKICLLPVRP